MSHTLIRRTIIHTYLLIALELFDTLSYTLGAVIYLLMNTDHYEDLEACPPPAHGRASSAVKINGTDKNLFLVFEISETHKRGSDIVLSRMRQIISSSIIETITAFTCH